MSRRVLFNGVVLIRPKCAVRSAKRLIDEVERQCPLPAKPARLRLARPGRRAGAERRAHEELDPT